MKIKEILSIILINLTMFFALISMHELSHITVGMLSGCKYHKSILIDSNLVGPYIELYCSNGNNMVVFLSGLLTTASFSFLFLLLNKSTKNLFATSLGLSIIFSSLDVTITTNIQSLFYPMVLIGFFMTIAGEYSIANSFVNNNLSLDLLGIEGEVEV
jgi:hypothetical protein